MNPRDKVLVTGGAGYLGHVLCHRLASYGHTVEVCDLGWNGLDRIGFPVFQNNCADLSKRFLSGYTTIIHLACVSRESIEKDRVEAVIGNHSEETAKLIENLSGQKLIYASSASVYGNTEYSYTAMNDIKESDGETERCYAIPVCEYGYQKFLAEGFVSRYGGTSLRMGTLMGPSPVMRHELLVNNMVKNAIGNDRIEIRNGRSCRPLLNISDAADAYLLAMVNYRTMRGVHNVAHTNYTIGRIAGEVKFAVKDVLGKEVSLESHGDAGGKVRSYCIDSSKVKYSGFTPDIGLTGTISQLCAYYS